MDDISSLDSRKEMPQRFSQDRPGGMNVMLEFGPVLPLVWGLENVSLSALS